MIHKKKDILFLGLHRPNRSPSQRYRIEQFLPDLEKNKRTYDYEYLLSESMDKKFYASGAFFSKGIIVLKSVLKLPAIAVAYAAPIIPNSLIKYIFKKIYQKNSLIYSITCGRHKFWQKK